MLAMVPRTFAIPYLLEISTFSSLRNRDENKCIRGKAQSIKELILKNKELAFSYLRAEAMTKEIAGTEFCIADAKVGDA